MKVFQGSFKCIQRRAMAPRTARRGTRRALVPRLKTLQWLRTLHVIKDGCTAFLILQALVRNLFAVGTFYDKALLARVIPYDFLALQFPLYEAREFDRLLLL